MGIPTQAILRTPKASPLGIERFEPVTNDWRKPAGGLWSSTHDEKISDWARFCKSEGYCRGPKRLWLAEVDPGANVFMIDRAADLRKLYRSWTYLPGYSSTTRTRYIDYEAMAAAGIDGLQLTADGYRRLTSYRLGQDIADGVTFASHLGCESTVWLRWCFTSVQPGPLIRI